MKFFRKAYIKVSPALTMFYEYYSNFKLIVFVFLTFYFRYRFAEVRYLRPEEVHKGKHLPTRVETTVIFFPDVWSCSPSHLEWTSLQTAYKKQLQKKIATISDGPKDPNSQAEHFISLFSFSLSRFKLLLTALRWLSARDLLTSWGMYSSGWAT